MSMASYWKSPYKERPQPDSTASTPQPGFNDRPTYDTFVPVGSRSYCGLSKVRNTGASPQDWFDWAVNLSNSNTSLNNIGSNSFRSLLKISKPPSRGKIKGILKTSSGDADFSDTERGGQDCDSVATSVISDPVVSRKEKKRVTFGENQDSDSFYGSRFRPDRSVSSYLKRPRFPQALDDLAKQAGRKQKTESDNITGNLPSIVGTSAISTESTATASLTPPKINSIASTCKHSADLRCAHCVLNGDTVKHNTALATVEQESEQMKLVENKREEDVKKSYIWGMAESQPESSQHEEFMTKPNEIKSSLSKNSTDTMQEPLKRYKPHWSKTFLRAQRRKNGAARTTHRRIPFTPRVFPKPNAGGQRDEIRADAGDYVSEEFSKLNISGDGKVVRVKVNPDLVPITSRNNLSFPRKIPKSTVTSTIPLGPGGEGSYGAATPEVWLSQTTSPPVRVGSAPSRLRDATTTHSTNSSHMVACLDKTSQILTWLNDVRTKDQFKPRSVRTYQAETEPLRL